MMAFVQCCVLGLLAIVGLQDGNVVTASRDTRCDSITLTSTWRDNSKEEITDRNGRPVEFTSVEFSSLGKVPCERGENLFVYDNKFHVKNGCTAKFSYCYRFSDDIESPHSSDCKIITLLSKKHREHTEDFDERIDKISIVEQFKDSADCQRGDNFGTRDKVAFAREGCQGRFEVCFRRTPKDCKIIKLKSRPGSEDIENFDERIDDITVDEQYKESVNCVRGKNFGRRDNIAYASDGCRGKFKVCFKRTQEECKTVKLLSRIDREHTESFDEKIDDITVEKQYNKDVNCVKGTNFGIRDKIAYASKGCRGTFKVCFRRDRAYDDCDIVKLKSSLTDQHQYIPTDEDGHPVTIVSVRLMKDLKDSTGCVEDKTYRWTDNIVTSRKGCHGKFKVCYKKREPEAGSKGCIKVHLSSTTSFTHRQRVADDSRKIRLFELWRQEEGIKCIRDTNYGVKDGEIFAKGGCKGYFKVCLTDSLPLPQKEKSTCVNVYLTSYSHHEPDWTTVTDKDGNSVNITEFTLVTEYSKNVCIKGTTYYISESDKVNAKNGCQAKIRVCYKS